MSITHFKSHIMAEGGISGPGARYPFAGGKFYWVDAVNGNDGKDGRTPQRAKKTLTEALAKCVSGHDDYIFPMATHQPAGETWPIVVDKSNVHIIGVPAVSPEVQPVIHPPLNTAALNITGNRCEVAGIGFAGGAAHACIETGSLTGVFGITIHGCSFGHLWSGCQDGIRVMPTFGAPDLTVFDCIFGAMITRDGIRVETNATRARYLYNQFCKVAGIGIDLSIAAGVTNPWIIGNRFALPSDTKGKAITLGALGGGGFIDDNRANYGVTEMSANPYLDEGSNHWGVNYKGITATMPATS